MKKFLAILRLVIFLILIGLAVFFIYKLIINAKNKSGFNDAKLISDSSQSSIDGSTSISPNSDTQVGSSPEKLEENTNTDNKNDIEKGNSNSNSDSTDTNTESENTSDVSASDKSSLPSETPAITKDQDSASDSINSSVTPDTGAGFVGAIAAIAISSLIYLIILKKQNR